MEALRLDIRLARRSFDLTVALGVAPGESVALVGPSGAGKSSVLRAVAGLDRPQAGTIALGEDVWFDPATWVAPDRRAVGWVPQELALFPHLSVRRNVAFGGQARADELLERFGIAHLAQARPDAISGGERQRVALARALARSPRALLLDEPLSSLDADTGATVRAELRALLAELGLPTLLVTHDPRDAAALADRVGVLVGGTLRQLAPPAELLRAPADAWVARFTGASVLDVTAVPRAGGGCDVVLSDGQTLRAEQDASGPMALALHPWEGALLGPEADGVRGTVQSVAPEGPRSRVRVAGLEVEVTGPAPRVGAAACVRIEPVRVRLLPRAG